MTNKRNRNSGSSSSSSRRSSSSSRRPSSSLSSHKKPKRKKIKTKRKKQVAPTLKPLIEKMNAQLNTVDMKQYKLLTQFCPESSDCVILGKHMEVLKAFFNNFKSHVESVCLIGAASVNGFVNEITYNKQNYKAYCVLKSSQKNKSDNLYFEWYIGHHFINELILKFPCFIETYSLGYYVTPEYYDLFKTSDTVTRVPHDIFEEDTKFVFTNTHTNMQANMSCITPTQFCVLTQHMNNPTSLKHFIRQHKTTEYGFNIDMLQIFLQIFIPLGKLAHRFTHNDLHHNNVLLYTIPNKQYIILKYTFDNGQPAIEIKTRYVVKIIDYGRAYYYSSPTNSSAHFFHQLSQECKMNQKDNGYNWFRNPIEHFGYTSQTRGNISKDLWLPGLFYIHCIESNDYYQGTEQVTQEFMRALSIITLGNAKRYGAIKPTNTCVPNTTCNVLTFMNSLCRIYTKNIRYIQQKYDEYLTGKCIGQLTIFADDLTKNSVFDNRSIGSSHSMGPIGPSQSMGPIGPSQSMGPIGPSQRNSSYVPTQVLPLTHTLSPFTGFG
jgi:hypothetical protein